MDIVPVLAVFSLQYGNGDSGLAIGYDIQQSKVAVIVKPPLLSLLAPSI